MTICGDCIFNLQADFILDWVKDNQPEMAMMYLSGKYNVYHYELHKVYLKYALHKEAPCGGTSM